MADCAYSRVPETGLPAPHVPREHVCGLRAHLPARRGHRRGLVLVRSVVATYSKLHQEVRTLIFLLAVSVTVSDDGDRPALQPPQCILEPKSHNVGPGGIYIPSKLAVRRMLICLRPLPLHP